MGKIDRKPKYDTVDNIIKYINQLPNRDRDETIKGLWTFEQLPNVGVDAEHPFFAGYLGSLLPSDAAPEPGKSGYYKFSSEGPVAWLDDRYAHASDEVSVSYNSTTGVHTYTFIKIVDRSTKIITDILTESSDGVKVMYPLSAIPMGIESSFLYINGVYRDNFYFTGQNVVLPYVPEEDSRITIKYYTVIPTSEEASDYDRLLKLEQFYRTFMMSLDLLTHLGEPVTYLGEYLYVDATMININGLAGLIAEDIYDDTEKLINLALLLEVMLTKESLINKATDLSDPNNITYPTTKAIDDSNLSILNIIGGLQDQINNIPSQPQTYYYSETPPPSPQDGIKWMNLNTGVLLTYTDGVFIEL